MKPVFIILMTVCVCAVACSKKANYKANVVDTLGHNNNDTFVTMDWIFVKFEPVGKNKKQDISPTATNVPSFLTANFMPTHGAPPFIAGLDLWAKSVKLADRGEYDITVTSDAQTQPCIVHYQHEPLRLLMERLYMANDVYNDGTKVVHEIFFQRNPDSLGAYTVQIASGIYYYLDLDLSVNGFHFSYPKAGGGTFYDDSAVVVYYDVARHDSVHSVWHIEP